MSPARFTARKKGLASCHTCDLVVQIAKSASSCRCPRCGAAIHSRKVDSLRRTWALILAAVILYVPANIFPVMTVIQMGQGEPKTIFTGVLALIEAGTWPLAAIVFIASIVVPIGKLGILVYLMLSIQWRSQRNPQERMALYRLIETFGHWSMVDVFLVTILVALVDMGSLATIEPGVGVSFFGAVVVITLFAAHTFDPRLIWDVVDEQS